MSLSAYRHFLMIMRREQREIEEQEANGNRSRTMTLIEAEIEILQHLDGPADYALRKDQFLRRLFRNP